MSIFLKFPIKNANFTVSEKGMLFNGSIFSSSLAGICPAQQYADALPAVVGGVL